MKKKSFFALILTLLFLTATYASAISLDVNVKPISDVVIAELDRPAVFNLEITNTGDSTDSFEIYSLANIEILPKNAIEIRRGTTETVKISVYPAKSIKERIGINSFVYKIKAQQGGIQDEIISLKVVHLKDLLEANVDSIDYGAQSATVRVQNKENIKLENIGAVFNSAFFSSKETLSLDPFEKKVFIVPIDREKSKTLIAGKYILTTTLKIDKTEQRIESTFSFIEKPEIISEEATQGALIRQTKITKTNNGNLPSVIQISVKKNIISDLFTTFNTKPDNTERSGLSVMHLWQHELKPAETLIIITTTNFIYPILIIIIIIIAAVVFKIQRTRYIILQKRIVPVRTKSGEFALKVILGIKARKFVEKITLIDRMPQTLKLHERFGTVRPERIDEKRGRVEWYINDLHAGEERIFSYIIYSKIAPLGKFELPRATAIFERLGNVRETESNTAFIISDPKENKE